MERPRMKLRVVASTRTGPRTSLDSPELKDEENNREEERGDAETSPSEEDRGELSPSESSSDSETDSSYASSSISSTHNSRAVCIRETQLSSDGSCIFTSDHDRTFSVYASNPSDEALVPYASFRAHGPIRAFASYPGFDINNSETTTVLVSVKDSHITLHNAIWNLSQPYAADHEDDGLPRSTPVDISTKLADYKLINHLREEVISPLSLTYNTHGTHFLGGSLNQISIFDMEYTNDPIHKIVSTPRKRSSGMGPGFKGYVSSLNISPKGILAAGTWARHISIFDKEGLGEEITQFSVSGMLNGRDNLEGDGISQLKWSPCGTYLYIAERNSDAVIIFDSRKFGLALGHCVGRCAMTKQKLGFDLWSSNDQGMYAAYGESDASVEVWAGGTDGNIRVWRDPHLKEGSVEADEVHEIGEVPVVSTLVLPSGNAVVAASGNREHGSLDFLELGEMGYDTSPNS